jgi:hypothetical protein
MPWAKIFFASVDKKKKNSGDARVFRKGFLKIRFGA